jgi:hypothetical protein
MKTQSKVKHPSAPFLSHFSFEKHGDALHFKIEDNYDLEKILDLDEALWIATTAPVSNLKVDKEFLELLDSDQDDRIRAEEIKDGIRFLLRHLTDYSSIQIGNMELPLSFINKETDIGSLIHMSAIKVLNRLQAPRDNIKLSQVRKVKAEVLKGGLDQAGIVLPEAAENLKIEKCIGDILSSIGGRTHPNGTTGIDDKSLDTFFKECLLYRDWLLDAGEIGGKSATSILPLGANTARGYSLFQSLLQKLTQYFLLCDIKRLNPNLLERALSEPEDNVVKKLLQIEEAEAYLADVPLSILNTESTLDLSGDINPYFQKMLREFTELVVEPLLGKDTRTIDKQAVRKLTEIFEPYVSWVERKPEVRVDRISAESIQDYLTEPSFKDNLKQLLEESYQTAIVLENLKELERLLLYQAYMLPLTNSFVSFPNLYNPDKRALFEEGTLIMDGRHFTLAIKVDDHEHHVETCKGGNIFVIYCDLYGIDGKKNYKIAVPVTSGSRGTIHLNKWGIFNDVYGNELHAKVVDIVENPISVGEAVVDPFIRINRTFFSRLEQFSSKAEEQIFRKDEKKDKDKKKKDGTSVSLLAGGGVAIAAVGSSFAFITKTLSGLTFKTVVLALLVVAAIIAVPAGIAAYFKLTRRDLSTVLEGSGWGINSRMKLTADQATCFTFRPKPPTG